MEEYRKIPKEPPLTQAERKMIDDWLKSNKPTIKECSMTYGQTLSVRHDFN